MTMSILINKGSSRNTLQFLGKVLGHMQLDREHERGGGAKNYEPRYQELSGPGSSGGLRLLSVHPPILPQHPSTTIVTVEGAIPQAPGRPVGQSRGQPARICLDPVSGGRSVKVHCCRRWQVTLKPSGARGVEKKGGSGAQGQGRWGGDPEDLLG